MISWLLSAFMWSTFNAPGNIIRVNIDIGCNMGVILNYVFTNKFFSFLLQCQICKMQRNLTRWHCLNFQYWMSVNVHVFAGPCSVIVIHLQELIHVHSSYLHRAMKHWFQWDGKTNHNDPFYHNGLVVDPGYFHTHGLCIDSCSHKV